MKKNLILTSAFVLFSLLLAANQTDDQFVMIRFKNHSWLPKKCTIISYAPGGTGNDTVSYWLLPGSTKELRFKVGTRLYLANQKQVDSVMSGNSIDKGNPFLTVKEEYQNQTFEF
jgi:hypothetical protein